MKRLCMTAVIALAFTGIVSAQCQGLYPVGVSQSVTGTLAVRNGTIALEGNGQVYYIHGLERFIGFIDGLKEGARVTVEGYVYGNQAYTSLQATKLTINGKDYEVGSNLAQVSYGGRDWNAGHCGGYARGHSGWRR